MQNAKEIKRPRKSAQRLAEDVGLWLVFFSIIYVIMVLKVLTYRTIPNDLFFGFYGILVTSYILSRFVLAYFHKSPRYDESYQPTITFVVPAKNEEDNIRETLRRFGQVNYPLSKVEVVAINDGSDDGTYEEMLRAQDELSALGISTTVVHWEVNRGKRDGMAEGIKRAKNDIVIFIDSDSFIDPECVKHLVKYFVSPEVGAVSGHTDVFNAEKNLLTRMQAVRYYVSFTVYKAAESVFAAVTCCPGCCSAYRREYLMEFVDEWLHQTFFGGKCTFGDDRSLTNFTIRKYEAVYSPRAIAHTVVPDTWGKYTKQQQRWKKSWIRETFIAATFMWKKNPAAALFFYLYLALAFLSPVVFVRAIIWYPISTHLFPYIYMAGLLLMLSLQGIYYRIETGNKHWVLAIIGAWWASVILIWQLPWAFFTLRDSRWGTR